MDGDYQNIRFEFRVRVARGLVKPTFSRAIAQCIEDIDGVERVSVSQFVFTVDVIRPATEIAKDISLEFRQKIAYIGGVVNVKELSWSRY